MWYQEQWQRWVEWSDHIRVRPLGRMPTVWVVEAERDGKVRLVEVCASQETAVKKCEALVKFDETEVIYWVTEHGVLGD